MTRPTIPRVPVIVAKCATSRGHRLMLRPMNFMPLPETERGRAQARDQETKDALIASFPPPWRQVIFVVVPLDGSQVNIELRRTTEEAALGIGRAFEQAFPGREITFNVWWKLEDVPGARCAPWSVLSTEYLRRWGLPDDY